MPQERADWVAGRPDSRALRAGDDALIARLSGRQRGRVTRAQLLAAGVTVAAIKHRLRCGRLHPEHDGVYTVGYRTSDQQGRFLSALLAVGCDAALSRLAAAAAHGFGADPVIVDVTCPRRLRSRRGLRLHHQALDPRDVTSLHGLRLTSPAQTLFDLSTLLPPRALAGSANEAFVQRLCTIADLSEVGRRNRGRGGSVAFRRLLASLGADEHLIRSHLEVRLHAFLRARGFPPWESNVRIRVGTETVEADVLWRAERVIVEADGRDPHLAPLTFASDRRRDRRLRVMGWQPVRVTSHDLGPGAEELEADLRSLLKQRPPA